MENHMLRRPLRYHRPVKPVTLTFIQRQLRMRLARAWRNLSPAERGLPSFIIIGAQKAGTTSLFKYLRQHPGIAPAHKKEIKFFDCNYANGLDWYRSHFPKESELSAGRITGEASPHYLSHPLAPLRIQEVLPEVRLIALLRNPVERAYSHYQLNVRRRREHLSFEEALDQEESRLAGMLEKIRQGETIPLYNFLHYAYVYKGLYAEQLENWLAVFPRQQVLILQSERLFARPAAVFQQVQEFLGLPAWAPKKFEPFNTGRYTGMEPAVRQRLLTVFGPHNQRLFELLGEAYDAESEFPWE